MYYFVILVNKATNNHSISNPRSQCPFKRRPKLNIAPKLWDPPSKVMGPLPILGLRIVPVYIYFCIVFHASYLPFYFPVFMPFYFTKKKTFYLLLPILGLRITFIYLYIFFALSFMQVISRFIFPYNSRFMWIIRHMNICSSCQYSCGILIDLELFLGY